MHETSRKVESFLVGLRITRHLLGRTRLGFRIFRVLDNVMRSFYSQASIFFFVYPHIARRPESHKKTRRIQALESNAEALCCRTHGMARYACCFDALFYLSHACSRYPGEVLCMHDCRLWCKRPRWHCCQRQWQTHHQSAAAEVAEAANKVVLTSLFLVPP